MVTVSYPAALHQRHYYVAVSAKESYPRPLTGRIHRDKAVADLEMRVAVEEFAARGIDLYDADVVSLDVVYLARCGVCAELPGDKPDLFEDWCDLQEQLRIWCPTWVTTDDLYVFCPRHQPSGVE
jgi:hypothetical protein